MTDLTGIDEEDLFIQVYSLCKSKAEEFSMLGYENITAKEVWECVSADYKALPPVHKLVNDILSLKTTKFMNWQMLKIYKNNP